MAIVKVIDEAMRIIETIGGMVRGDDIMFIRVSLHVMNVYLTCMCVQTKEGCEDQKLHRDAGHKDSLSVLIFIGDGAININGSRKEMVANSAVVFSNALPHGGVSHNGGIRVFFYIDFGWFVPSNSEEARNDEFRTADPIEESSVVVCEDASSIARAVVELYCFHQEH